MTQLKEHHDKTVGCEHVELSDAGNNAEHIPADAIVETERALSVLANAKKHWRVLLIACVSFTAGITFGFDVVINGASISLPSFLLYFGEMGPTGPFLPSVWTSLALTLIGTAVQFVAKSRASLMGGKMISGLGIGAVMAVGTVYLAEIAPIKLRAPLQTCLVVFVILIQALALGVIRIFVPDVRERAFRIVLAIQWPVGFLGLIAWALAPESPLWLIRKGKIEHARAVMKTLYGSNNSPDERLEHEVYLVRSKEHHANVDAEATWMSCFRGQNLKRLISVAFLYSTANIGGAPFLSQNIYFLTTAGLAAIHSFDVGIGGFALAVVLVMLSSLYLQRISRRNAVLVGLSINMLFMLAIAALYWAPGKGALWAIAVLMNVLISFQSAILQAAGWPIAAEIPSPSVRAKRLSVGICSQTFSTWLFQFITPYMYNVDSGNLGARTGFVYAGTSLFLIIVAWLLVPDTTAMTAEEIDHAYESRIPPRKFQKHVRLVRIADEEVKPGYEA